MKLRKKKHCAIFSQKGCAQLVNGRPCECMITGGSTSSGGGDIYSVTVFAGETAEQRARAYFAALAADFEGNPLRAAQALDRRMIAATTGMAVCCPNGTDSTTTMSRS